MNKFFAYAFGAFFLLFLILAFLPICADVMPICLCAALGSLLLFGLCLPDIVEF